MEKEENAVSSRDQASLHSAETDDRENTETCDTSFSTDLRNGKTKVNSDLTKPKPNHE